MAELAPLVNQRPIAYLFGFIQLPNLLTAVADSCTIHYLRTESVALDTVIDEVRVVPFLKLLISGPNSLNFWRNFELRTLRMPTLVLHLQTSEVAIRNRFAGEKTDEEIGVLIERYGHYLVRWLPIREEYFPFVREVLVDQPIAQLWDDIRNILREWSRDQAWRSEKEGIEYIFEKQVRAMLRENQAESDTDETDDSEEDNEDDPPDEDGDHQAESDTDDSDDSDEDNEDDPPDEDGDHQAESDTDDSDDSDEDNVDDPPDEDGDHQPESDTDDSDDSDEDNEDDPPDEDGDHQAESDTDDSDDSDEDNEDDPPDEDEDQGYKY